MNQRDDHLLDACLAEVLGGTTPPDLTSRILQALEATNTAAHHVEPEPPPVVPPHSPIAPPIVSVASRSSRGDVRVRSNQRSDWQSVGMVVVTVLGFAVAFIYSWQRTPGTGTSSLAQKQPLNGKSSVAGGSVVNEPTKIVQGSQPPHAKDTVRKRDIGSGSTAPSVAPTPSPASNERDTTQIAKSSVTNTQTLPSTQGSVASPRRTSEPVKPDGDIVAFINATIRDKWSDLGVVASQPATDAEWCRRVYLRLIGRIPTVDELQRFADTKGVSKRAELVERLVTHDQYAEELASHWGAIWANALVGRGGATSEERQRARDGLRQFVKNALHHNKPFDQLARELISATGSNRPGDPNFNAAVHFVVANADANGTAITTRVSRAFLGLHLQCAQCHTEPSNDWQQEKFWQLNAFFRQMELRRDSKSNVIQVANRDFVGEDGQANNAEVFFERQDGVLKVAYPVFVDGTELPRSGRVAEVDRRGELAKLVAQSDYFPRAIVNRMWGQFFGYGFTQPVDDLGPHKTPSHPELLDGLASQFAAQGFDMKRLMRWIALSEPFALSSKFSTGNTLDRPEAGTLPLFAHYYTRQMQPEELFQSLQVLATARKNGGTAADRESARVAFLGQFNKGLPHGEFEEDAIVGKTPRALMQLGGEVTQKALRIDQESLLGRVTRSALPLEEKIDHLFQASLARKPSRKELSAAKELVAASGESETQGLQDLWWALLNSNEFILDH